MKYQALKSTYWSTVKLTVDSGVVITEVTEDRVIGTRQWCNEQGTSSFNVKRTGDKFALGSGSGKTRYILRAS